jgi:hypothetical protein
LETKLEKQNFRVVLLGDFNVPVYYWVSGFELVVPDTYHPPLCTDLNILTSSSCLIHFVINLAVITYALPYEILSSYDWYCVYKQTSVDSAVIELNYVVVNSLNQTVPYTCASKSKFPCSFSGILKHYNKKNHFFRRYKKN